MKKKKNAETETFRRYFCSFHDAHAHGLEKRQNDLYSGTLKNVVDVIEMSVWLQ
jgi:hypothetical protein